MKCTSIEKLSERSPGGQYLRASFSDGRSYLAMLYRTGGKPRVDFCTDPATTTNRTRWFESPKREVAVLAILQEQGDQHDRETRSEPQ